MALLTFIRIDSRFGPPESRGGTGACATLLSVRSIRRHLATVFGVWLLCHTCALAIAPVSMCVALAQDGQAACSCNHAGATECPMHHRTPVKSTSDCVCRSTSDAGASMLATLFGPVALVSTGTRVEPPALSTVTSRPVLASIVIAPAIPEPPPPRA